MKFTRAVHCFFAVSLSLVSWFFTSHQQYAANTTQSPETVLQMRGLRAQVTVRRDGRGIPYIEAANDEDLMFAQGYVTASDRLWQMDLLRRTARGELAEIFGRGALDEDKRHRTLGFAVVAEGSIAHLTPLAKSVLSAYAQGVNAYIASCDEQSLPVEFRLLKYRPREWRIADSIAVSKNFSEALSTSWTFDVMRAGLIDLPKARRELLLLDKSPLDVLLVGRDEPAEKTALVSPGETQPSSLSETAELLRALNAVEHTRRLSLELSLIHI